MRTVILNNLDDHNERVGAVNLDENQLKFVENLVEQQLMMQRGILAIEISEIMDEVVPTSNASNTADEDFINGMKCATMIIKQKIDNLLDEDISRGVE